MTHHGRRVVHHLLDGQITFVAYEQFVDVLARVALDLLEPLLDVVERLLVRAVVHYDDAVRAPVVRRRDRTESLLASRVPLHGKRERESDDECTLQSQLINYVLTICSFIVLLSREIVLIFCYGGGRNGGRINY